MDYFRIHTKQLKRREKTKEKHLKFRLYESRIQNNIHLCICIYIYISCPRSKSCLLSFLHLSISIDQEKAFLMYAVLSGGACFYVCMTMHYCHVISTRPIIFADQDPPGSWLLARYIYIYIYVESSISMAYSMPCESVFFRVIGQK